MVCGLEVGWGGDPLVERGTKDRQARHVHSYLPSAGWRRAKTSSTWPWLGAGPSIFHPFGAVARTAASNTAAQRSFIIGSAFRAAINQFWKMKAKVSSLSLHDHVHAMPLHATLHSLSSDDDHQQFSQVSRRKCRRGRREFKKEAKETAAWSSGSCNA